MWRFLICVAVLGGCAEEDGECRQARTVFRGENLPAPADAPPGTVYSVTQLKTPFPALAGLADGGVAFTTCEGFAVVDRIAGVTPGGGVMGMAIAASEDTIYLVRDGADPGDPSDLGAYTRDGGVRWLAPLNNVSAHRLAATAEGVFAPSGTKRVTFFAAADGRAQTVPLTDVIAFGAGGVFTAAPGATDTALTLQRADRAGTALWTRTWTGTIRPEVFASAADDGGLLVRVGGPKTLDLGDRVLEATEDSPSYLVALAPDGTTRWAFELNTKGTPQLEPRPNYLALLPNGDAVLAMDDGALGPTDGYLAYANAGGVRRVYPLTGVGDQRIASLAVSPDGLVWLEVSNYPNERRPGHDLSFASREYHDTGDYIFALVP